MFEKLKNKLDTILTFCVIVGMVFGALAIFATKSEVVAIADQIQVNTLNDQLRETNSAIIQTDKQLMWLEQKLAKKGRDCNLDSRWRELRGELDLLKLQRTTLMQQIKEKKASK
jgi:CII-binding regulator of phage lambda lysogenization HflD